MPHYIVSSDPDTCPWEHNSDVCRYGSPYIHRHIRMLWWLQQMKDAARAAGDPAGGGEGA